MHLEETVKPSWYSDVFYLLRYDPLGMSIGFQTYATSTRSACPCGQSDIDLHQLTHRV